MTYLEEWRQRRKRRQLRRYFNAAIKMVPFLFKQGDLVISLKEEPGQEPTITVLTMQIFFKEKLINEYHYIPKPSA